MADQETDPFETGGPETEIAHAPASTSGGPADRAEGPRPSGVRQAEPPVPAERPGPTQEETSYSEEDRSSAPQPPEPDNDDPTKPTKAETGYTRAEDGDGPGVPHLDEG